MQKTHVKKENFSKHIKCPTKWRHTMFPDKETQYYKAQQF